MEIITHENIISLDLNDLTCLNWVKEDLLNKQNVILPKKISMRKTRDVFCNVMPCMQSIETGYGAGVKVVTRYPESTPSLNSIIYLFDDSSGAPLALLDGNWITAMRTGAVAALSIDLLAKFDFSILGLIGLGNTMRSTLRVLLALHPERLLTIKLMKYKQQHDDFVTRFSSYQNIRFILCDSYDEVIKGSDVVISATTFFGADIADDAMFDEGVLVVPIHTRGFSNCDLFFDKVFADDFEHVKDFKYFDQFRSFYLISELLQGRAPGRLNNQERIIVYNIGIALHDVSFAKRIFDLLESDILLNIDLKSPKTKFWI